MKHFKMQLACIAGSLMLCLHVNAQTGIADSYVAFDSTGTGMVYVEIADTVNTSHVEVSLGSDISSSDIFFREYVFDVTSGLPSGIAWQRTGNEVFLGIGTFPELNSYYCQIRVKVNGTWGSYYKFLSN